MTETTRRMRNIPTTRTSAPMSRGCALCTIAPFTLAAGPRRPDRSVAAPSVSCAPLQVTRGVASM